MPAWDCRNTSTGGPRAGDNDEEARARGDFPRATVLQPPCRLTRPINYKGKSQYYPRLQRIEYLPR